MIPCIAILLLLGYGCKKEENGTITVITKPVTEITTSSAKCGGNVIITGKLSVGLTGICWSESPSPTTRDFFTTDNTGAGEFLSTMRNLRPETKYYVRAYATVGSEIMYGEELVFTTEALPTVTIIVYTNEITEITSSSAKSGGVVTANGDISISVRGVCWSVSQNPTINDSHTSDGEDLGAFSSILSGLVASTTYYIKAYAITSDGDTIYGDTKSFTTASDGGGGGGNEVTITVYTNDVTEITTSTAKCGGVVTANGDATITARGIYWSTSQDFSTNVLHTSDGQGLGSFTSNLTGLTANTTYYVKAYATAHDGNVVYSNETKTFITQDVPGSNVELPTVEIGNVTDITSNSAKCSGNVISDGGSTVTERGLCWSTSTSPMVYHSHIACGSNLGSFIGNLTELNLGTTYYVRAYATNSEGTTYSSEEKTFTTLSPPTVITSQVTNIGSTYAIGGGIVSNAGSAMVYERGICWSTSSNPNVNGSHAISGAGTGNFMVNMIDLSSNTTYYVRAYAISSVDIAYGDEVSFHTTIPPQAPMGAINGLFSVGQDMQVWFSQGNLQFKASTHTWRFAENQFDYMGVGNKNISSTYSGWIDLYGWGTSGWNCGNTYYRPWDYSINPSNGYGPYGNNDLTGSYANSDWGYYNSISNGGNQSHQWRTLSHDEWEYVVNTRITISGIRYAKAQINTGNDYVNGLILLPDDWSTSYYTLSATNQGEASYSSNIINYTSWVNNLQPHGAVFLPAGGMRWGTTITGEGSTGCYSMSSSCVDIEKQCCFVFRNTELRIYGLENGGNFRETGQSVRLVRDVQL